MLYFTCTYCQKPGATIVIDDSHFVHVSCRRDYEESRALIDLIDDTKELGNADATQLEETE